VVRDCAAVQSSLSDPFEENVCISRLFWQLECRELIADQFASLSIAQVGCSKFLLAVPPRRATNYEGD